MSGPTLVPPGSSRVSPTGMLPSSFELSRSIRLHSSIPHGGPQPHVQVHGLGSSPFARRYLENHCCFLFLRVLRCFSSPRSLPYLMYWDKDTYALPYVGSPIRTSAGLWICAPHRSFSQLITSFVGSQCQGIPLMLLLT